jgi:hypothetical protein
LRPLMRPHQIRNLWRTAALYEARMRRRQPQLRIYVRYFLVVKSTESVVRALRAGLRSGTLPVPLKLCRVGSRELILAWSPDAPTQKL